MHQLRDGNINSYWQSDGPQPHCVNIQFPKTVAIIRVEIYTDLKLDESYTPSVISVRCGTHPHDLREVKQFAITDANGWISLPLAKEQNVVRASMVQLAIISNFQNGRDTHIRQVAIYGPQADPVTMMVFFCRTKASSHMFLFRQVPLARRRHFHNLQLLSSP